MGKSILGWLSITAMILTLVAVCAAQDSATNGADAEKLATVPLQVAPQPDGDNLLYLLQRGGPVMYPLYACSILVVAFWLERIITLRRDKVIPPELTRCMREVAACGDPEVRRRLLDKIQSNNSPMGRIIKAGCRKMDRPILELEKAIEDAGGKEMSILQRNNKVLSSVATIAPLLGLLGTVTGLMRSFMTVATSSDALGRTELLAAGIYEALVATAVGLAIAIPSMALYFYYQEQVDKLVGQIDEVAAEFIENLLSEVKPRVKP